MTRAATALALRQRYETTVTDWPIEWDNQQLNRDEYVSEDRVRSWSRFTVLFQQALLVGLGQRRHRYYGTAVAQLFVPIDEGDAAAYAKADVVIANFRAVTFSSVTCVTPWVEPLGRTQDGEFWQLNVLIPFYSDETD